MKINKIIKMGSILVSVMSLVTCFALPVFAGNKVYLDMQEIHILLERYMLIHIHQVRGFSLSMMLI